MPRSLRTLLAIVAFLASVPGATAQSSALASCTADWIPTIGGRPGTDDDITCLVEFDDGTGAALYAGGFFAAAGGRPAAHVARWDGTSWSEVGSGIQGDVYALAAFDDGTGPALYAGGYFASADGLSANRVARWNGTSWSALGGGLMAPLGYSVASAFLVFDDGSGPALYVGGLFTSAGGTPAANIARWNGTSWSSVGAGFDGEVWALTVYDDGSGPALVAAGSFTSSGAASTGLIARWNGTSWSPMGTGLSAIYGVMSLAVFDDGSGPALFAGGDLLWAGGTTVQNIARWNGTAWSAVGGSVQSPIQSAWVQALVVHDDGSGPALYAGGGFTEAGGNSALRIARWNGTTWSTLGSGVSGEHIGPYPNVRALAVFDAGSGPALVAGGNFTVAGDRAVSRVAAWDGAAWSRLGTGFDEPVEALLVHDDGSGPALYAGGKFRTAGGSEVDHVVKWNGASWTPLGGGLGTGNGPNGGPVSVRSFATYDDGAGPKLYVGGTFNIWQGAPASYVARWNGTSWSPLGTGPNAYTHALVAFDDGSGPVLFAAGYDGFGGGARIQKWNGTAWSVPGGGVSGFLVHALETFDDGSGPALYASGGFTSAGGVPANNIARWNGTSWSALGSGLNDWPRTLCVADDGSGPALYAGGGFTSAGGVPASKIARWNGTSWSALGSGTNGAVTSIASFDDGTGPALYAAGSFTTAGGIAARDIARWNGTSWSAVGDPATSVGGVLATFDDGNGPALVVGGQFTTNPAGDSFLTRWGCANATPGAAFCTGDGTLLDHTTPCPCGNNGAAGRGCANSFDPTGAALVTSGSIGADTVVLHGSGMPASAACIYLQGDALDDAVFGDGVRCTGGALVRLRQKQNVGGASSFPDVTDTVTLSQRGGVLVGSGAVRHYQTYYRNAAAAFCPPATFNVTNGWTIVW